MSYDLKTISDENLKQLVSVLSDLVHKADLTGGRGPVKISNAPKGVSNDEQYAILSHLSSGRFISFVDNDHMVYLTEAVYPDKAVSFNKLYNEAREEHQKREKQAHQNIKPHYDEVNGILHIQNFKIKIRKHDEDTKQNQLLRYIFITNSKTIDREFDFTEFPFDDVLDKKKFKEICRTACLAINRKVAAQTQDKITDFLAFNTRTYGFLKINPKYLLG